MKQSFFAKIYFIQFSTILSTLLNFFIFTKSDTRNLNRERIDHGVRSGEDPELIKHIVDRKIALTMCPLSNLKLDVFKSMGHHNIKSLFNKGVRVTINSDDPAYFDGYILQNYMQCYKHLGFKVQQLCTIARYSIEASFLSNEQKEKLIKQIQELISTIK